MFILPFTGNVTLNIFSLVFEQPSKTEVLMVLISMPSACIVRSRSALRGLSMEEHVKLSEVPSTTVIPALQAVGPLVIQQLGP